MCMHARQLWLVAYNNKHEQEHICMYMRMRLRAMGVFGQGCLFWILGTMNFRAQYDTDNDYIRK